MYIVVKFQDIKQKQLCWADVPTRLHEKHEEARVEAERLARKHPGNYFGVFVMEVAATCSINPVQWIRL